MEARTAIRVHALVDQLAGGGAEMLIAEFAKVAPQVGVELSIAALRGSATPVARRLRALGVEPSFVEVRSLWQPADVRTVRDHLRAVGPDLLHTHLGYADLLGGLAARTLDLPTVSTIHADWWGGDVRDRVRFRLMALARRRCAARVIAVSDSARQVYLAAGWDRPERVVVVRNGIAAEPVPGSGAAVRRELGLRADDLVVSMVSRLGHEKGHAVAVEAVRVLRGQFPRLRLLIVGDGPLRGEIERQAAPLGEAVRVLGQREDPMAILDASDLLLHPSHMDAYPTTLLEAMAASVPILASAVGGIVEIVEDGRSGVLIAAPPRAEQFAAGIATMLGDDALRARLVDNGLERYRTTHAAGPWAHRTRAVYDAVLAERAG